MTEQELDGTSGAEDASRETDWQRIERMVDAGGWLGSADCRKLLAEVRRLRDQGRYGLRMVVKTLRMSADDHIALRDQYQDPSPARAAADIVVHHLTTLADKLAPLAEVESPTT
jgi:hypothetical protein